MSGYDILCLGMNFYVLAWNFIPEYDILYQHRYYSMVCGYEILYLGMKCCTWVCNVVPRYETLYLGM
jgi:hypothetical protein